ncbi:MAG: hypothetical protein FK734_05090 [Asgard group archaeon]|nr:hypothetical protein [Asgard group archaeon]
MTYYLGNKCHMNYKHLTSKTVFDSEGKDIGYVKDIIFDTDFNPIYIVLAGNIWQTLSEKLGFKKDDDPVVSLEDINDIEDTIQLRIAKEHIKCSYDAGVLPKNVYFYSEMKNKDVIDKENKDVGKIKSVIFLPCEDTVFIVRGTRLESVAKALGIIGDEWDLLVPRSVITEVLKNKVKINLDSKELERIMNEDRIDQREINDFLNQRKVEKPISIRALAGRYGV